MSSIIKVSYFVDVDNEELSDIFDGSLETSYVLELASEIATTLALDVGSRYTVKNDFDESRTIDVSSQLSNPLDKLEVEVAVSKVDDPEDADLIFIARQETWDDALESKIEAITENYDDDYGFDWEDAYERVDRDDFTEYDDDGEEIEFDEWGYDEAVQEAVNEIREERIAEEEEDLRADFELTLEWLYESGSDEIAIEIDFTSLDLDNIVLKLFEQAYPDRRLSFGKIKEAYGIEDSTFSFNDHIELYEQLSAYDARQLSEGESSGAVINSTSEGYGISWNGVFDRVLTFLDTKVQFMVSLQRDINDPLKDILTKSDLIERVKSLEEETLSYVNSWEAWGGESLSPRLKPYEYNIFKLESEILLSETRNKIELSFDELFYRGQPLKSEDCLVFLDKAAKTLNIDSPELEMFGQPLTCQIFLGGILPFDIFVDCENLIISNTQLLFTDRLQQNYSSYLPFSFGRREDPSILRTFYYLLNRYVGWQGGDNEFDNLIQKWVEENSAIGVKYTDIFKDLIEKVEADLYRYAEFLQKPEKIKRFLKKQRKAKLIKSQTHISSIAYLYNLLFLHDETAVDSLTLVDSTLNTSFSKRYNLENYPYKTQTFVDVIKCDKSSKISSQYRADVPALVIKGTSSNIKSLQNVDSEILAYVLRSINVNSYDTFKAAQDAGMQPYVEVYLDSVKTHESLNVIRTFNVESLKSPKMLIKYVERFSDEPDTITHVHRVVGSGRNKYNEKEFNYQDSTAFNLVTEYLVSKSVPEADYIEVVQHSSKEDELKAKGYHKVEYTDLAFKPSRFEKVEPELYSPSSLQQALEFNIGSKLKLSYIRATLADELPKLTQGKQGYHQNVNLFTSYYLYMILCRMAMRGIEHEKLSIEKIGLSNVLQLVDAKDLNELISNNHFSTLNQLASDTYAGKAFAKSADYGTKFKDNVNLRLNESLTPLVNFTACVLNNYLDPLALLLSHEQFLKGRSNPSGFEIKPPYSTSYKPKTFDQDFQKAIRQYFDSAVIGDSIAKFPEEFLSSPKTLDETRYLIDLLLNPQIYNPQRYTDMYGGEKFFFWVDISLFNEEFDLTYEGKSLLPSELAKHSRLHDEAMDVTYENIADLVENNQINPDVLRVLAKYRKTRKLQPTFGNVNPRNTVLYYPTYLKKFSQ